MKHILQIVITALLLSTLNSQLATAFAQGTTFTYQGRLNNNGAPANGSYDFSFALINSGTGGLLLAGPVTNAAVFVTNGLFTTTMDFGNVFNGSSNWLQIDVSAHGANSFQALIPRQQLTPTPYAIFAESANAANLVGTIPAGNLSGAALLNGGNNFSGQQTVANGNVGIGTTTPQHTLDVNGNIFFGKQANGQIFTELGDTLYLGSSRKYLGNTLGAPVDGSTDWINLMAHPLSQGIMFGLSGPSDTDPHSAPVPLMVIKSSGNVGIGVTNPGALLTVGNDGDPSISLIGSGGNGELDFGIASFSGAYSASAVANDAVIRQSGSGKLFLQTGSGGAAITINTNNSVGIGTTTPNSDSLLQVKGMVRMGSETGTSEAPNRSILVRRINSTSDATNSVVAIGADATTTMTLIRDGTPGGLIIKISPGGAAAPQIVASGINSSGATVNFYAAIGAGGANSISQIFTDAQKMGYVRISFGDANNASDFTTVEMMRYVDNGGNNTVQWVGTVTSTVNQ